MEEVDKEILESFKKVEVNIPLLDAIKQIPRYAKFLKDLCTHKRKLKGNERISMGRNVSALIGKSVPHIPEKCKDPGTFCVPCIIGNNKFENAMLDLGASINVLYLSIFNSLSTGHLNPTGVVILPRVIYYASRTLDAAQENYTTTEKELLAIVFALDKFQSYLLGSRVIVFIDHAALKYLLKNADSKPRLIRWML
uniref:Retrovirus-related Pol polyprotein from transposon opus n=1 Tax=Cajanus cajan TaxID=3821 RepID=A0A151UGF4_CAJCA